MGKSLGGRVLGEKWGFVEPIEVREEARRARRRKGGRGCCCRAACETSRLFVGIPCCSSELKTSK